MVLSRLLLGAAALLLASSAASTCGSSEKGPTSANSSASATLEDVQIPSSIDVSALTPHEKREWKGELMELLAPCPTVPVSIGQCLSEHRDCAKCVAAARFLEQQVRDGRTKQQAADAYRDRFDAARVKSIDLTNTPALGPAGAPVTVVEWADFECPFCKAASPALNSLHEKYPTQVRLYFKNYPLSIHENSETAARAAIAADAQGKFWPMHDKLFETRTPLRQSVVEGIAKDLGLNVDKLRADMTSDATTARLKKEKKEGEALGLQGTPMIFINGREFSTHGDFLADLEDWVHTELDMPSSPPAPAAPAASSSR